MKSIVIYPSYKCNLSCPYCWVRNGDFEENGHIPLERWGNALRDLPKDCVVDIVGGEPTLLRGLYEFCSSLPHWAITTNLALWEAWEPFCARPLTNHEGITCSWHEQMPKQEFLLRLYALSKAGYHVRWSRVESLASPGIVGWEGSANVLISKAKQVPARPCNAGMKHIVIDPKGTIYRCQTWLMEHHCPMGNLFKDGPVHLATSELCDLSCAPCYLEGQFGVRQG